MEQPHFLPNYHEESYQVTDDGPPLQRYKMPKNQKWLPHKERYLLVILDMKAPPSPRSSLKTPPSGYLMVHLGHGEDPCPSRGHMEAEFSNDVEDEEHDLGDMVNDIPPAHLKLMMAGLFPATTKEPRTVFTFEVLNDFIRENVECGTSAMNYYTCPQPGVNIPETEADLSQWVKMSLLLQDSRAYEAKEPG
ncbi:hypothetical protein J3A83DRAFT_4190544 [Scleroderma citrinum]